MDQKVSQEYIITGVPTHAIDKVWEQAKPLVEKVDMHGRLHVGNIYTMLKSNRMQLWLIEPLGSGEPIAASLTEVAKYPLMTVVRVVALGGKDMDKWIVKLIEALERFATLVKARVIEANTREGLARKLKKHGFERTNVFVQREVENTTRGSDNASMGPDSRKRGGRSYGR